MKKSIIVQREKGEDEKKQKKGKEVIGIWMLVLLVMAGVSVVKFRFSVEGYAAETGETSGTEDNTETTGETEPTSGECGENLKWDLSDDGTLTISGLERWIVGAMRMRLLRGIKIRILNRL